MIKISSRSGIKLRVPKGLTKAEHLNASSDEIADRSVTLYMNKQSILNLRYCYEDALKKKINQFSFEGNEWLTEYAKIALKSLESEAYKRGWL